MNGRGLDGSSEEARLKPLMLKAQSGDRESYNLFLRELQLLLKPFIDRSFYRVGLKEKGGEEDVLQETLLAIHEKRANFRPEEFLLPWVYAITRYKVVDYFRRNKRVLQGLSISLEETFLEFEMGVAIEYGVHHDLRALCQALPQKQREILIMVKIEGHTIKEVREKTGYEESDIKVSVHRALKFLEGRLSPSPGLKR